MSGVRILAFAGSARKGSFNKLLVKVAAEAARTAGAEVTYVDLRDFPLPVFDADLEAAEGEHPNARRFKDLMISHDGFLIASPENNSSYSALLKNMIDWASRRSPDEEPLACFARKTVAVLSASPGALGGMRGLAALRVLLGSMKCLVLPGQVTIPSAHKAFNADGALTDPKQAEAVRELALELVRTVERLKTP